MNRLDKNIRYKLDHMTVPVADHNWEKIANRLDNYDSKRPVLWPYFAFVIIVLTGTIGIWLLKDNTDISGKGVKQMASSAPVSSGRMVGGPNKSQISESTTLIYDKKEQIIGESIHESNDSEINMNQNFVPKSKSTNSKVENNSSVENIRNEIELSKISTENEVVGLSDQDAEFALRPTDEVQKLDTDIKLSLLNQSDYDSKLSGENGINAQKTKKSLANTKVKKEQKGCPFGIEGNSRSLDFYVSHDMAIKNYSTDNANLSSIAAMRESSETPLYSFSVGARFGYNVSYRWNIHTGLNFTQINDKFSYIDPESNQERQITIKDYITENGVIVDSVVTIETVVIPGTVKIEKMNKFRSLDIPVIGRYTILANKNLSLSATIGAYFNLTHASSGTIVDINGKPVDIEASKINKTQLGVSSYTGFSLAYHLAGDLDFILEPHARIYFDNINKDSNPINQRQNVYGIATGVRYKF